MRIQMFPFVIASLLFVGVGSSRADAGIRIYGGPVQSAGSGRYYPPGDNVLGSRSHMERLHDHSPEMPRKGKSATGAADRSRIDLNVAFTPGSPFTPPGYVPAFFPRSSYFAYDYFGYHFASASR